MRLIPIAASAVFVFVSSAALSETIHMVERGENLSKIARSYFGDGRKWVDIFEANRGGSFQNSDLLFIGQKLIIPELEHGSVTPNAGPVVGAQADAAPPVTRPIAQSDWIQGEASIALIDFQEAEIDRYFVDLNLMTNVYNTKANMQMVVDVAQKTLNVLSYSHFASDGVDDPVLGSGTSSVRSEQTSYSEIQMDLDDGVLRLSQRSSAAGGEGFLRALESTMQTEASYLAGQFEPDATYFLINRASQKPIGAPGAAEGESLPVHQWVMHGGENQQFRIEAVSGEADWIHLVNVAQDFLLTAPVESTASGGKLSLQAREGGPEQQFSLEAVAGHYVLTNRASGSVVDLPQSSRNDGAEIILWGDKHRSGNQQWKIVPTVVAPTDASPLDRIVQETEPASSVGFFQLANLPDDKKAALAEDAILKKFPGEALKDRLEEVRLMTSFASSPPLSGTRKEIRETFYDYFDAVYREGRSGGDSFAYDFVTMDMEDDWDLGQARLTEAFRRLDETPQALQASRALQSDFADPSTYVLTSGHTLQSSADSVRNQINAAHLDIQGLLTKRRDAMSFFRNLNGALDSARLKSVTHADRIALIFEPFSRDPLDISLQSDGDAAGRVKVLKIGATLAGNIPKIGPFIGTAFSLVSAAGGLSLDSDVVVGLRDNQVFAQDQSALIRDMFLQYDQVERALATLRIAGFYDLELLDQFAEMGACNIFSKTVPSAEIAPNDVCAQYAQPGNRAYSAREIFEAMLVASSNREIWRVMLSRYAILHGEYLSQNPRFRNYDNMFEYMVDYVRNFRPDAQSGDYWTWEADGIKQFGSSWIGANSVCFGGWQPKSDTAVPGRCLGNMVVWSLKFADAGASLYSKEVNRGILPFYYIIREKVFADSVQDVSEAVMAELLFLFTPKEILDLLEIKEVKSDGSDRSSWRIYIPNAEGVIARPNVTLRVVYDGAFYALSSRHKSADLVLYLPVFYYPRLSVWEKLLKFPTRGREVEDYYVDAERLILNDTWLAPPQDLSGKRN